MSRMTSEHWLFPDKKGRVEITWDGNLLELRDVRVCLDRRELGTIETHEELKAGKDFPLPDGTVLRVQANEFGISVYRDGDELPPDPGDLTHSLRWALIFFGAASIVIAVILVVFPHVLSLPDHPLPQGFYVRAGNLGFAGIDLLMGIAMLLLSRYVTWKSIPPAVIALVLAWVQGALFLVQIVSLLIVILPVVFMTILSGSLILQILWERRWEHEH